MWNVLILRRVEMTTKVVVVPYVPQTLVDGDVAGGQDLSFRVDVPADAKRGGTGSVSVGSLGGASFNAIVTLSNSPDVHTGTYRSVDQTFYYQIATTPVSEAVATGGLYQAGAGEPMYLNITLAHDGKPGHGPHTARCECRAAQ